MPLYLFNCPQGHQLECFFHSWQQAFTGAYLCAFCGLPMNRLQVTPIAPALFFEESCGGRVIENLGHAPMQVTSAKHHRQLMKQAGVTWATKDDMLHAKTRRALDVPPPNPLQQAFQKIRESL